MRRDEARRRVGLRLRDHRVEVTGALVAALDLLGLDGRPLRALSVEAAREERSREAAVLGEARHVVEVVEGRHRVHHALAVLPAPLDCVSTRTQWSMSCSSLH